MGCVFGRPGTGPEASGPTSHALPTPPRSPMPHPAASHPANVPRSRSASQTSLSTPTKETHSLSRSRDGDGNKTVNEYVLVKPLGKGSFGKVSLCYHVRENCFFAIKKIRKDMLRRQRLGRANALEDVQREIAIMKQLDHPNVVRLHEVIDDATADAIYLVMEYVEGGPLLRDADVPTRQWQHRQGKSSLLSSSAMAAAAEATVPRMSESDARLAMRDILCGLDYLHRNKIIHRDIKPQNLLRGADGVVKLADFSVSTVITDDNAGLRKTAGSPAFLAPELCTAGVANPLGPPVDIYATGVTLYLLVCGRLPFMAGSVVDLYDAIREHAIPLPPARAEPKRIRSQDSSSKSSNSDAGIFAMDKDPADTAVAVQSKGRRRKQARGGNCEDRSAGHEANDDVNSDVDGSGASGSGGDDNGNDDDSNDNESSAVDRRSGGSQSGGDGGGRKKRGRRKNHGKSTSEMGDDDDDDNNNNNNGNDCTGRSAVGGGGGLKRKAGSESDLARHEQLALGSLAADASSGGRGRHGRVLDGDSDSDDIVNDNDNDDNDNDDDDDANDDVDSDSVDGQEPSGHREVRTQRLARRKQRGRKEASGATTSSGSGASSRSASSDARRARQRRHDRRAAKKAMLHEPLPDSADEEPQEGDDDDGGDGDDGTASGGGGASSEDGTDADDALSHQSVGVVDASNADVAAALAGTVEDATLPAVSAQLRLLLAQLLCKDPAKRLTVRQLRTHAWITDNGHLPPLPTLSAEDAVQVTKTDEVNAVSVRVFGLAKLKNRLKDLSRRARRRIDRRLEGDSMGPGIATTTGTSGGGAATSTGHDDSGVSSGSTTTEQTATNDELTVTDELTVCELAPGQAPTESTLESSGHGVTATMTAGSSDDGGGGGGSGGGSASGGGGSGAGSVAGTSASDERARRRHQRHKRQQQQQQSRSRTKVPSSKPRKASTQDEQPPRRRPGRRHGQRRSTDQRSLIDDAAD